MAGKLLGAHKNGDDNESSNPAAPRPMLNKEVKLDELSKYFHLPEKAVAKELGICLTSLKKLCRSYGITRWPFRKLKSLERTMRKVQTENDGINGSVMGNGDVTGESTRSSAGEVKVLNPYQPRLWVKGGEAIWLVQGLSSGHHHKLLQSIRGMSACFNQGVFCLHSALCRLFRIQS